MIKLERTQQITDIIHGNILYTGLEGLIISNPIFNRLHRILQSSLVCLTYSSNKVKRFEHSVGVMHLSGEILYQSINNTNDNSILCKLLEEVNRAIKEWFLNIDFTGERTLSNEDYDKFSVNNLNKMPYPDCSLYKNKTPQNIGKDNFFSYYVLFQSVRIAALLHDVGHLPYSHIFEHATQKLYVQVKELKNTNIAQQEFINIVSKYCEADENGHKKELHEQIGIKLVKQIKAEIEEVLSQGNANNLFVLAVFHFVQKILESEESENTIFSDMHNIIAGVLDADRLDYCSRDLFCCGVNKDIFPYQRLFSNYRIIYKTLPIAEESERKSFLFCPALKNTNEVEELLERRWKIFSGINFHHRVHKHEVIFAEILAKIGFDELANSAGSIPELSTGEALPLKLLSIWSLVKKLKQNNALIDYLIIQLDDGWMDTLLKHAFFEKYGNKYRSKKDNFGDAIWNKFDELISTKKHYFSQFKRSIDFFEFDKRLGEEILKRFESKKIKEEFIRGLLHFIKENQSSKENLKDEFYFDKIRGCFLTEQRGVFFQYIEKELNCFLSTEEGKVCNIVDCMICDCNFKTGFSVNAPIYLTNDQGSILHLDQVSKIRKILLSKKCLYLPFHVYYLPRGEKVDLKLFLEKMIEIILNFIEKHVDTIKFS